MVVDSFSVGGKGDVLVVSTKLRRFSVPGPTTPTSVTFTVVDRGWEVYDSKRGYDGDDEA